MTGIEFKRIRTISGFTAKEFAEHIDMSASYVYSLEQLGKKEITPRREEEFIEFLGATIFDKSKRIYELELENRARFLKEQDELRKKREKEEEEEEERERLERQQQLLEKKARRDAELEEQVRAMESQMNPVYTDTTADTPTAAAIDEVPGTDPESDTDSNTDSDKESKGISFESNITEDSQDQQKADGM